MRKVIYLDNSATTKVADEVAELALKVMKEDYGNPSSMHILGIQANAYIEKATKQLADALKVDRKEFIFTSCGTEADNLAIIGSALANPRNGHHVITSAIEHPAVLESMKVLEGLGYELTVLPVDEKGVISLSELESAIRPDTFLVSIMAVNNEVGSVQPLEEAGRIIKEKNSKTLFHVDAVQGFGKIDIRPKKMKIDLLTISGHKIHAPKGIGALYVQKGVKLKTLMPGGGQQNGLRSGTDNVPGIAAIGLAANLSMTDFGAKTERLFELKKTLTEGLSKLDDVKINGPVVMEGAPHIVSASFPGVRAEVLLHALEEKGIFVSSGSACATHHPGISGTLSAMGLDKKYLESTIRFSMSDYTTEEDISYTIESVAQLLPVLRRFTKK